MNNNNDFNFFVPFDEEEIEKAAKAPIEDRYKNMYLKGLASDSSKDLEGEILEPNGYDLTHFLSGGYINYEHLAKKSARYLIGEPIEAKVVNNEMHIKAKLWEDSPVARDAWDKIIEMKKSGSKRKAGWSIEGKAIARNPMNPKHITKALITNCALTFSAVNQNSFADICKGNQSIDFVEPTYDQDTEDKEYLMEFENKCKKYRVGKDYKVFEVIAKAMDVASVKPLTPESLDKKPKNIALSNISKSLFNVLKYKDILNIDQELKNKLVNLVKNSL